MPVIIEDLAIDVTPTEPPAAPAGLPALAEGGAAGQFLPLIELLREREERLSYD